MLDMKANDMDKNKEIQHTGKGLSDSEKGLGRKRR
jgi:hypothetical protein